MSQRLTIGVSCTSTADMFQKRMTDAIAPRLLDQRIRNRFIELFDVLSKGDEAVRDLGWAEYFNYFFDWFPDEGPIQLLSTMTDQETEAAERVLAAMRDACDATPRFMTDDDLISTGWPQRILPIAKQAADIFLRRGRFDEDVVEPESS
ncbi:hypothetical protein [Rhizobium sp. N122]|uniref:hypothetical protein n=1 Tax=Rhizobium sp. N122 TaxID=1764272 RepID=UPI00117AB141|nr:hypothetical protein [Rhizobium sp. N122]